MIKKFTLLERHCHQNEAYRVKVVSSFLKAGVPLSKLYLFRDLLEENCYRLASRHPMSDVIHFILSEEKHRIKDEIAGKDVLVIFDGTSQLGEALTIVVRIVNSSMWCIEQRIVRMQLLVKTVCGDELAHELISVLSTELGIPPARLLAVMHDRASTNVAAMRALKIVYPRLLDVGCFSHTLDHVGDHFVVPVLDNFSKAWISIFAHSSKARLLWKERKPVMLWSRTVYGGGTVGRFFTRSCYTLEIQPRSCKRVTLVLPIVARS